MTNSSAVLKSSLSYSFWLTNLIVPHSGISTGTGEYHAYHDGWNGTLMPDRETFLEENFASMDYAVYRAGQLGLKLVVPLTDEWNYYHGGMQDFLGWRGQSDIDGELDNCVCNIDQHRQAGQYLSSSLPCG